MAYRTPRQIMLRRRVEAGIGFVAPLLDLVLFTGERVARVAGRNQVDPEPPRLARRAGRTPIGAPPGTREAEH